MYNTWFVKFAPDAYRKTRIQTTADVEKTLKLTANLTNVSAAMLRANPAVLPTLRMSTCPPIAVDRLIGLAGVSGTLVCSMGEGKLAARMKAELLEENLKKICGVLSKFLDRDIFPWIDAGTDPTDDERDRALTIVTDRLCSAVANDPARVVRRRHQQFQEAVTMFATVESNTAPDSYAFDVSVPLLMGRDAVLPVDVCVCGASRDRESKKLFLDMGSASSRREARVDVVRAVRKRRAFKMTYHDTAQYVLILGGVYDAGCLGVLAAEGVDWVWQHRIAELSELTVHLQDAVKT
jgi:hypothetical protein